MASYLNASVAEASGLDGCLDHEEVWRGALVVRERKVGASACRLAQSAAPPSLASGRTEY